MAGGGIVMDRPNQRSAMQENEEEMEPNMAWLILDLNQLVDCWDSDEGRRPTPGRGDDERRRLEWAEGKEDGQDRG